MQVLSASTLAKAAQCAVLLLLVGVPLTLPFLELIASPAAWQAWSESERLTALARNTLILTTGTLLLAMPAGVLAAVPIYRMNLPVAGLWRFLILLALFVPLPLVASAWQSLLGSGGFLGELVPSAVWQPWPHGMTQAVCIHAVSAFPWVVFLTGHGLCWVEPELEEDASLDAGPLRVLAFVTLPRGRGAIAAAAIWVALLTATEITVTDLLQVRTFAEEVYFQFVGGGEAALARSVAVSLPQALIACGFVWWGVRRLERDRPSDFNAECRIPDVECRMSAAFLNRPSASGIRHCGILVAVLFVVVAAGLPVVSLVWKSGLAGAPPAFDASIAGEHLLSMFWNKSGLIVRSLLWAGVAGVATATLALTSACLARGSPPLRALVIGLAVMAWALPGPVVGYGLKETIARLLDAADLVGGSIAAPVAQALYYGPSPLPVIWAWVIRFYPCALVLLWPIARLVPTELHEAAQLDGAGPLAVLRHVDWPLLRPTWERAALAVAVLAVGEVSASKLVATPGAESFAQELFNQMHYGVTNDLAALCLVLSMVVTVGAGLLKLR